MDTDEIVPHVGIGLGGGRVIRLGMPEPDARAMLGKDRSVRVEFDGNPPCVSFIESPHAGTFQGIELFEDAADEVVAEIARRLDLDTIVYRPGRHTYYFPDLRMTLWRGCVSDVEGDQGYNFDSVSVHAPGYYDADTLDYIREQSGLPPLT